MKTISLLGATGSIGLSVFDVVRKFPDRYRICAMAAGTNIDLLSTYVVEFRPEIISVLDEEHAIKLQKLLPTFCRDKIYFGEEGNKLVAIHPDAEMVMSAIVGSAGLLPTLAAIHAGKDIGLANKETLVMAGKIIIETARKNNVNLFPVDSEHSAIFQALEAGRREDVKKIILTASGGPFHGRTKAELASVTVEQALNHPNWEMGNKISIDSATLMNKGLEVIEAKWLFELKNSEIEVVVHPQSIIHSLVEYCDGSMVAQLGIPDMKIPISYALSYPERLFLELPALRLADYRKLTFFEPDYESFLSLRLAFDALAAGGTMPAVLNAANEVAVDAFLQSKIGFLQIPETVAKTMDTVENGNENNLEQILQADCFARIEALRQIEKRTR